jgi:hypothetical protein
MAYHLIPVSLTVVTDVSHQCWLHRTRDNYLIGILKFSKPNTEFTWADIEYCRRRIEEMSLMLFPECVQAMIINIQEFQAFIDNDAVLTPWRLQEEDCLIRLIVPQAQLQAYAGIFDATWLNTDVDSAIKEIREFMDMFVH